MSMDGARLGGAIYTALVSAGLAIEDATARSIWVATVGPEIVAEISANAVVTVTSVSGVTTGGGVSGSGSGTIA